MKPSDLKNNIPDKPGVYIFRDKDGKIVYVGKAANLKNRVLSYWQPSTDHTPAKEAMIKKTEDVEWIETDSEIEALLLEANMIKKHQPDFNIVMRDDKRYAYIKISHEEEWPRVYMTRQLDKSGKYFGPFVSVEAVRETLKVIGRIWPYRLCLIMPKKSCLYYRIGKCPGMCEDKISKSDYKKIIKKITLFLEGRKDRIMDDIDDEIKEMEKRRENEGGLSESEEGKLRQLKYQRLNIKKVLAHSNIISITDKYAADVVELAKMLGLSRVPERIEGYDISNIFGQEAVGSMVVFSKGEPSKTEYRKFKIRIGQGEANDTGMLTEILERRFNNDWPIPDLMIIDGGKAQLNAAIRLIKKDKLDIPVISVSKGEGLRSAHAPDKIFFEGESKPLELPLASPALHIIKRVRDEAHRFAIKYHRELRSGKLYRKK